MSHRIALAVGFALGYYFGTKAGRERYEQIRRVLDEVPLGVIGEKAGAVVKLGVERLRPAREPATVLPFPGTAAR